MIHKSENLSKIKKENAPFNHYETKCGIYAPYQSMSFLWAGVECKKCLVFMPIKTKKNNRHKASNESKDKIKKLYFELKKLKFNYNQMVLEMNRLGLKTQTGRTITIENLKSFIYRNNL